LTRLHEDIVFGVTNQSSLETASLALGSVESMLPLVQLTSALAMGCLAVVVGMRLWQTSHDMACGGWEWLVIGILLLGLEAVLINRLGPEVMFLRGMLSQQAGVGEITQGCMGLGRTLEIATGVGFGIALTTALCSLRVVRHRRQSGNAGEGLLP
jgi:hypothetical protein